MSTVFQTMSIPSGISVDVSCRTMDGDAGARRARNQGFSVFVEPRGAHGVHLHTVQPTYLIWFSRKDKSPLTCQSVKATGTVDHTPGCEPNIIEGTDTMVARPGSTPDLDGTSSALN